MRSIGLPMLFILTLSTLVCGLAQAKTIEVDLSFTAPLLQDVDGATRVTTSECTPLGQPGYPLLPACEAVILLPPGEEITSIRVNTSGGDVLTNLSPLVHAQTPYPISMGPGPMTEASQEIYGRDSAYPAEAAELVTVQRAAGHALAFFRVTPFAYNPVAGELAWFEQVTLEVETALAPNTDPNSIPMLRRDDHVLQRVSSRVMNREDMALYSNVGSALVGQQRLDPGYFPYVIVTTDAFASAFEPLANFASSRGLHAHIMTTSEIDAIYSGDDQQMRIRNFIIDAYETWGTLYVVLGGDYDVVPVRPLYVNAGGTVDNFPGDCYYEGLDGNWNNDGDSRWGEDGEYDLVGEVAVGRVSISNVGELNNWLHKNELYTEAPVVSEVRKALFIGERMDDIPTWGGDSMDEVKDYCTRHGYTTSGYPGTYVKETLYDRDGTWSKNQVIALFNEGHASSHHLGHSNVNYNMKMENSDVDQMTADGVTHTYCFISSQGCISNNFDNPSVDSISEAFLVHEYGAVAYLGNTRYGWYMQGSTNGPSQHFDRQLVDALYDEGIHTAGWMNIDSKADCIWMLNDWMLWCHYELCLLGDPAMPQWTNVFGTLSVDHTGMYLMGTGVYEVTVRSSGIPMAGASVTLYSDDMQVWGTATTNASGVAIIDPGALEPMTLNLKAVKTDYLPVTDLVEVVPPSGPYLVYNNAAVHDGENGELGFGETAGVEVFIENVGIEVATGVIGTLSTSDDYATVTMPVRPYPNIPAGMIASGLEHFEVQVAGDVPDQHVIDFAIDVVSNEGAWDSAFNLIAQAPVLSEGSIELYDSDPYGNGNGGANAGETFYLEFWIANTGHADATGISGTLSCTNPDVVILDDTAVCPIIPMGDEAKIGLFQVELLPTCPEPSMCTVQLDLTGHGGFVADVTFEIAVGGWFDDVEADHGWTLGTAGDDASTGRWERADPRGTTYEGSDVQPEDDHTDAPGTICFVTGNGSVGGSAGEADVDGGSTTLLTPVFDLGDATAATVEYWRWYTNDLGNNPGEDWWDVDVTNDGQNWVSLEHTQASNNSWARYEFDLGAFVTLTDHIQIRFIADDTSPGSLVEAAVDDFMMTAVCPPSADVSVDDVRAGFGLISCSPNPFNPRASIVFQVGARTHTKLEIYDISGSKVRTLVDQPIDPGMHSITFDGNNDSGHSLASGIYFLRMKTPEILQVKQIALLK